MLDHLSSLHSVAEEREAKGIDAPKRHQSRGQGVFIGVDVVVGWDGPTSNMVQALRHTGLERLFVLQAVSRGTSVIWQNGDVPESQTPRALPGHGLYQVRFDATAEAGARAEAHLPRLLESIASRMTWHQVEKCYDVPMAPLVDLGDWSGRPLVDQWRGDAA